MTDGRSPQKLAASLGTQRGGGRQVTLKHRGKARTVYVPRDLTDEVEAWVQEHRRIKRLLKEITTLQLELIRLHQTHKARRCGGRWSNACCGSKPWTTAG